MKLAVYGAGAIGGAAGTGLAAAGEDVVLVDVVAEHVAAMNASGLRVGAATGEQCVRVQAALPDGVRDRFDLIFLAVKTPPSPARSSARARRSVSRRRSAEIVYGALDGDDAGRAAAERFADQLGQRWLTLALPDGCDLNDLGRRPAGRATFFHLRNEARSSREQGST